MPPFSPAVWSLPVEDVLARLNATAGGLSREEGERRLATSGANRLRRNRFSAISLLLAQFSSPIILLLIGAAGLSFVLDDPVDAGIIIGLVLVSGLLGFFQERGSSLAVEKLLSMVRVRVTAIRDGVPVDLALDEIVPGDVVRLKAGDSIPGDCRVLEAKDPHVNESALTGETFPVEKAPGVAPADAPPAKRGNSLFLGTHVISGTVTALVTATGSNTEFGKIAERLRLRPPETQFEQGVRHFGYLLMEMTLILALAIFAINVTLHRPALDSLLFSLALAVGLTPQLLPAIISVNLSRGARRMAAAKVIVKRLAAIENLGSMDVLCSDKTGTLTLGVVELRGALNVSGKPCDDVFLHAYLNASLESGFTNPLDEAIRNHAKPDISAYRKLDEVPYDFLRRRLSILVAGGNQSLMIAKGALDNILNVCSQVRVEDGKTVPLDGMRSEINTLYHRQSEEGNRVLGLAIREMGQAVGIAREDEKGMTFLGFLVFFDPPKPGVAATITEMRRMGVALKMVTGDNRLVAAHVAKEVGLTHAEVLTGPEIGKMTAEALRKRVEEVDVFAEVEPQQKELLVAALRKGGHVVGFLGDGINDVSALHTADVGISVDSAVDVAKEAADIVLLEKQLGVLSQGIEEGRQTFANTMKYVFMATSANFGNMFSMAGASLFLPFLPLLPKQILLMNVMTDLPEMAIASDCVDPEMVQSPRRWDIRFIRKFMLVFGALSSLFDYLTFGLLIWIWGEDENLFRTAWFVESIISATAIVLVIRSRRPFIRSQPGRALAWATATVIGLTLALPYSFAGRWLNFVPLPFSLLATIGAIVLCYVVAAEFVKRAFYARVDP
ncbi:magnesium-translocating P-type ATPase [Zavarzinella formosa]|uniref:magnesium-translocating P-type ATPase n=1 Tax=Zavarzinella formosa TaxID=360055 RepID=UPI0002E71FC3|nr:magnesium-translocating P-type ATPase [Zavarzinella formosa]